MVGLVYSTKRAPLAARSAACPRLQCLEFVRPFEYVWRELLQLVVIQLSVVTWACGEALVMASDAETQRQACTLARRLQTQVTVP